MNETLTVQMKLVSYVQFQSNNSSRDPIVTEGTRNAEETKKQLQDNEIGFYFFDVLEGKTTLENGEEVPVSSKQLNHSPFYYVGGSLHSEEEFRASAHNRYEREEIQGVINLAKDLEINQYYLDRFGKWQIAFSESHVILSPE